MNETTVRVDSLRKTYGSRAAVDGVSFEAYRGEIFGILGPNGAGKTTTLECLEGLRKPDGGQLRILNTDPLREAVKLRNLIGVQLQTSGLPESMAVREAMRFFCAYHRVNPRYDLLERLGLKENMTAQYRTLSTGQQRRLALALAVAHHPPVVFLDEPTAGLDVASRTELHSLMKELKSRHITILLATHDMAEAEKMADRVVIILRGKTVATGSPRELTATGDGLTKISVRAADSSLAIPGLNFPAVKQQTVKEGYHIYFSTDIGPTVQAIIAYIEGQGDKLIDLRVERPSLEERFLEITHAGGK